MTFHHTGTRVRTRTETIPEHIVRLALAEKERAEAIHGRNSWPLGTGHPPLAALASHYREATEQAFAAGTGTWAHLILEETFEALAETDPREFAVEALQAIGLLVAAIEDCADQHPNLLHSLS